MSHGWDSLPLLPLRCILEHLSTEDAMAAMSTCRHWRSALLLYQGRKDTLKLKTRCVDKTVFLTKLFRKYVKRLHIYVDCNEQHLDKFLNYVMPQYFDAVNLQEILFIGPSFMQLSPIESVILKRIITESLVFKHIHNLKVLAYLGCELTETNEDKYIHRHDFFPRPHPLSDPPSADAILSRRDLNRTTFSNLEHIIVDYEQVSTEAIETLASLNKLSMLSLNIFGRETMCLRPMQWLQVMETFGTRLSVTLNIISLPYRRFHDIIDNVLVEGIPLVSLKVFYCKMGSVAKWQKRNPYGFVMSINVPLVDHLVRYYRNTLQELLWADDPDLARSILRHTNYDDTCEVNPLMMLCWQCTKLRRLAVHGYWVWQYDVLGFVRLRPSLRLELSSVIDRPSRLCGRSAVLTRVLYGDPPLNVATSLVEQVNQFSEVGFRPITWSQLPPGLRQHATPAQRSAYVIEEITGKGE